LIIGLTGGIASGKSTAARMLGTWGAHVIDADKLGHQAYLQGSKAYDQVIATFGNDVVGDDGEIDRRALGAKVFGAGNRLSELTDIVWPAIRRLARKEIEQAQRDRPDVVVVLEAAVLIEAGWQDLVDEVWLTVVDPAVAVARARARDGVDAATVQARIDAQLSNAQRETHADKVIDNSGTEAELIQQLEGLWASLQA
jgi:phosphopantetheine adenylyltransferase/dephospho-CoA kinase